MDLTGKHRLGKLKFFFEKSTRARALVQNKLLQICIAAFCCSRWKYVEKQLQYPHENTQTRAHAHTRTNAHAHTRTRAHAYTRTRAHAYTRTHAHTPCICRCLLNERGAGGAERYEPPPAASHSARVRGLLFDNRLKGRDRPPCALHVATAKR